MTGLFHGSTAPWLSVPGHIDDVVPLKKEDLKGHALSCLQCRPKFGGPKMFWKKEVALIKFPWGPWIPSSIASLPTWAFMGQCRDKGKMEKERVPNSFFLY